MKNFNGSANHVNIPTDMPEQLKDYGTHADASAFMAFKSRVVSEWVLALRPTSASRAVLRGFIARLDPAVADRIYLAVCEQIAADAIVVDEMVNEQMKQQVEARRRQGIGNQQEQPLPADDVFVRHETSTTPVKCGTCYDTKRVDGGERGEVMEPCPVCSVDVEE